MRLLLAIFFISKSSFICFSQVPLNDPHWNLIFFDDFITFNSSNWIKADYCDHGGEPQLYLEQNVFTSNGNLVLRLDNTSHYCPSNPNVTSYACGSCAEGYHNYTSGWVETSQAVPIHYGYIESRIKLPICDSIWPAFWTWTGLPDYQEIDIFEMFPYYEEYCHRNNSDKFWHSQWISTSNIHTQSPLKTNECQDPFAYPSVSHISDYTQWHLYGVEWSPSRIIWYVDNYPVRYSLNPGITASTRVIFNLAMSDKDMFGNCGFPKDYLIDYIKIYELNTDCDEYINSTNYDFSTHTNEHVNYISIGENGGDNIIDYNKNIVMRVSNYIEIKGTFEVKSGSSMYMDADKMCATNLSPNCTQIFNPCNYSFDNYDNLLKKSIVLGGNSCGALIDANCQSILLNAIESILLLPDTETEISSNNSIEMVINNCF